MNRQSDENPNSWFQVQTDVDITQAELDEAEGDVEAAIVQKLGLNQRVYQNLRYEMVHLSDGHTSNSPGMYQVMYLQKVR